MAIPINELLEKKKKKFHILELHKWSKSHEEKDDEQGDEKDEN
jgi:predicted CopG family antitoxin